MIDDIPAGITDLTGTSWYFNQSLDITGILDEYELTGESGSGLTFSNIYFYIFGSAHLPFPYAIAFYSSGSGSVPGLFDGGWGRCTIPKGKFTADETERSITISGGVDATNSQLIEWFQSNATQTS